MLSRLLDRFRRSLSAFSKGSEGAVALEFALIGLPFLTLLTGILVIGFMLYCSTSLDYAVNKARRQIMIGAAQNGGLTLDQFKTTMLCPSLPSVFDCSQVWVNLVALTVTPQQYNWWNYNQFVTWAQTGLVYPATPQFCPGAPGTYQVMQVLYPFPLYLSIFSFPQVYQGKYYMSSSTTFKNEPYTGSTSTAYPGC